MSPPVTPKEPVDTPQAPPPTPARLWRLDALRALAILLVMAHHFRHIRGMPEGFRWFGMRGYVGVDVFFVMSGWLVGGQVMRSLARTGGPDVLKFWVRRWMRTLPVYFVVLAAWLGTGWVHIANPWNKLLFLQNYSGSTEWLVSWSLCVEEHFYVVLPLLAWAVWKVGQRYPRVSVASCVGLIAVSPVWRAVLHPQVAHANYGAFLAQFYVPTHLRLDGLFLGAAMAAWARWGGRTWDFMLKRRHVLAVVGGLLAVGSVYNPYLTGFSASGNQRQTFYAYAPAFLLVSMGVALMLPWAAQRSASRHPLTRTATFVAEHAYTLYLLHEVSRDFVQRWLKPYSPSPWTTLAASVAASFVAAWVVRAVVEAPMLRVRDRLLLWWDQRSAPTESSAAVS